jgi:hypothetical protein
MLPVPRVLRFRVGIYGRREMWFTASWVSLIMRTPGLVGGYCHVIMPQTLEYRMVPIGAPRFELANVESHTTPNVAGRSKPSRFGPVGVLGRLGMRVAMPNPVNP